MSDSTLSDAARIAQLESQVAVLTEQGATARRELESFIDAVSHDLRAPLRSLSGFSQALMELPAEATDPKAQHYLTRIQQAARKMSELIDALLSLARVSKADMQLRDLNVSQLCTESANAIAAKFPSQKVSVEIASDMTGYGDSRLLRTALDSLLDNAWKFTSGVPAPKVIMGSDGNTFFVRDNGIGFDQAYATKLFRPFQRLHAESALTGVGVGLAMAYRILTRLNGRIWLEAAPGKGTTVFFTLPQSGRNA
jgi:signal transduction histidine kinase